MRTKPSIVAKLFTYWLQTTGQIGIFRMLRIGTCLWDNEVYTTLTTIGKNLFLKAGAGSSEHYVRTNVGISFGGFEMSIWKSQWSVSFLMFCLWCLTTVLKWTILFYFFFSEPKRKLTQCQSPIESITLSNSSPFHPPSWTKKSQEETAWGAHQGKYNIWNSSVMN